MNDKQQIEEMAEDISNELQYDIEDRSVDAYDTAFRLKKKGWVKLPEDSVVLTEPERITMCAEQWDKGYAQARTETTREIFTKIFEDFNIDCGTYSINMARKKYMNAQLEQTVTALRKRFLQLAKQYDMEVEE